MLQRLESRIRLGGIFVDFECLHCIGYLQTKDNYEQKMYVKAATLAHDMASHRYAVSELACINWIIH